MLKQLLTLENLWKGLGHVTRWVIVPAAVLGLIAIGLMFVSDNAVSVLIRSNINSLLTLFIAVTALWLASRWLDWLCKTRFKTDVLPVLKQDPRSLAKYYSYRWLGLCILVGTVLATVRF
jgi:hypothetical protein